MKLFCRRYGTGKPLVILHGLFGLSDNWASFGRQMAEHFSVFIPDLRNHGQSPHSSTFNFYALESDLGELIDEYELDEIFLLGHSLGGRTAMYFALHHPDLIRKLVVADISLRKTPPGNEHHALLNAMMSVDLSQAASRSEVEEQLKPMVESPRLRQFLLKNIYWSDRHRLSWRPNLKAIDENLAAIYDGVDEEGSYGGPVLFIRGGRSDYVPDSEIPVLKNKFPGAEVYTIAEASHWVHADAPGEFAEAVKTFLLR